MLNLSRHAQVRAGERFCSPLMAAELFRKARHDVRKGKARKEVSLQDPSRSLIFWKGIVFVTDHRLQELVTLYPRGDWRGASHVWKK